MLPEQIETPRLTLRPWVFGDVDDVLAYAQDEEWSRFLRILPFPYERSDAEEFVARQVLRDRRTHPNWALVFEDSVIGGVILRLHPEHRLGELGYSIARRVWGRGLATEAASAVIRAAFDAIEELNRIRAMADARNAASRRVLEKLGMTAEGVLRQNRVERGEALDEAWYGILRSELKRKAT